MLKNCFYMVALCFGLLPFMVQAQCAITNVVVTPFIPCEDDGFNFLEVDVYAENFPIGEPILIGDPDRPNNVLRLITYTGTPTRAVFLVTGNGIPFNLQVSVNDIPASSVPACDNVIIVTTNIAIPLCPQTPAITNVQFVGFESCDEYGFAEAILEVYTQSATGRTLTASADGQVQTTVTANTMIVRLPVREGSAGEIDMYLGSFSPNRNPITSIPFSAPDCLNRCSISDFSLVSVTPLSNGHYQVITKVMANAASGTSFVVESPDSDSPSSLLVNGTAYFTNVVYYRGGPVELRTESSGHPVSSSELCPVARLIIGHNDFCPANDCPGILNATITFGPCDGYGGMMATVEVAHVNAPTNGFVHISVADTSYIFAPLAPVTGSPQRIPIRVASQRAGVPLGSYEAFYINLIDPSGLPPSPVPPGTSSGEVIARTTVFGAIPGCADVPRPPCSMDLQILDISDCHPAGYAEVSIGVSTNSSRIFSFSATRTGDPSTTYLQKTLTETHTFRLQPGTWDLVAHGGFPCSATQQVVIADCPNLCEVQQLQVIGVSDCLPEGEAEITFEVTAPNAVGTYFEFWSNQDHSIYDPQFGLYTNPPSVFRIKVEAHGEPIDLSVVQAINFNGTVRRQEDCTMQVHNFATPPNCFTVPQICLQFPPKMIDIIPSNPAMPTFNSPRTKLSFTVPVGVPYIIEQCNDDLRLIWDVIDEETATSNGPQSYDGPYWPPPTSNTFYRVRCKPVPVPVP